MINYRGHVLNITKIYSYAGDWYNPELKIPLNATLNFLYICKDCNFKCYNLNLNDNNEDILTCNEYIIKEIIE